MRPADAGTAFAIDDDFAVRRLARRGFRWPWWSAALPKNCFQSVTPSHSPTRLAEFERREKNRTALPYFHVRFLCCTFEIGIPIREVKAGARKNSKRIQPLTGHLRLLERRAFLSRITRPTGPASNWLEDENYAAANVESNCELHPGCGSVCAGFWCKPSTPGKYKLCGRAGLHRRAAPRQQGDRFGGIAAGSIARYSDW